MPVAISKSIIKATRNALIDYATGISQGIFLTKMKKDKIQYRGNWHYSISKSFVCNATLTRDARFLFIVLKSYTNDTKKEAFPSRELLCKLMQCSENSLTKYITELKVNGFLNIKRERNENGEFHHNVYEIIENTSNTPYANIVNGKNENLSIASNTNMVSEETNKYQYINNIYSYWNEQEIRVHRKLTKKHETLIQRLLKDYTFEEIKTAISNYAIIVKGQEYYFNYKWTLEDFLRKGFEKFINLEIAKNNYRDGKKNQLLNQSTWDLSRYEQA